MLQFVIGSSGAGKSSYVFDYVIEQSMRNPDENFLVIVPEQFTLQTQKELVLRHPRKGIMNIDVLSFLRLAFRVFEETGAKQGMVLEDMGKSLIVKRILMEERAKLCYFAGTVSRQGFAEEMKSVLSELLQYGVAHEELERLEKAAEESTIPALSRKMHDIALIYRAFLTFLRERFITTEGIFDLLAEELARSSMVRDRVVVLDGFTGFTPSQYALLRSLLRYAKRVIVTVTMDRAEAERLLKKDGYGKHRLFYTGFKTMETLRRLAEEADCEIEDNLLLPKDASPVPYRFRACPALAHLEKQLFRYPSKGFCEPTDAVVLRSCSTPASEMLETVCEIKRLVQGGLRYRDIAVVTGNMEEYAEELLKLFAEAGIPGFADRKRGILSNPLVELLRAVLELAEGNFSYDQVFRWAKCPLSGVAKEACDRLENYALAHGIRGKSTWEKEWVRLPEKLRRTRTATKAEAERLEREIEKQKEALSQINATRLQVTETLKPVLSVLRNKETTTTQRIHALREYLSQNEIEERLNRMTEALGEETLAKEYEQVFGNVEEIFTRAEELLSKERLTVREFREILETGFSEAKVGLVPTVRDQIVVGDMERTRLQDIKVLFFLGVNEGVVPLSYESGGVLSDIDREYFQSRSIALAPTAKERLYTAEYYLYLNLCKPSQRLYVSFARKSAQGEELRPSYLIEKLAAMYPALSIQNPEQERDAVALLGVDNGTAALISTLRNYRDGKEVLALPELFCLYQKNGGDVTGLMDAVFYQPADQRLMPKQVRDIYGELLRGSVTRMERYAQCALGYFLEYGLGLSEREVYRLSMPELGSILHEALELFAEAVKEDKKQWRELTKEEQRHYAAKATEQAVLAYKNEKLSEEDKRTGYLLDRVGTTVLRTVETIQEQLQFTLLAPEHFEADFHYEADGLSFYGKIDRIDLYEDEKNVYVKILDYKTGNTELDLVKAYHGLQMQLGLYLDAVLKGLGREKHGKNIVPAAMLYYHVNDPLVERLQVDASLIQNAIVRKLRPTGLLNRDKQVLKYLDSELLPREAPEEKQYTEESGLQPKVSCGYLPLRTNKDGELYESAALATQDNLERLREHLKAKADEFKEEILRGEAAANPYHYGKESACDYCSFRSVCSFDALSGKKERNLHKTGTDKIWEMIGQRTKNE